MKDKLNKLNAGTFFDMKKFMKNREHLNLHYIREYYKLYIITFYKTCAKIKGVSALQIKALQVPESIEAGQVVRLVCLFDPEQEDLYSVKWYKDDVEFFRFLPKDKPANQFFETRDVEVDMSRSSNGTVFLKNTSRSAEGMYRCEVSADAPSFQSIFSEKFMAVEDRPVATSQSDAHFLCPWTLRQILWTMLLPLILYQ
ncbi:ig-like domain-containing protein [Trichonephila clavata]|uniref:Ig-like domain-containing protein n=1 Tax=Trichonephila clavata TaxID=2740835 RepID=A0A8X6KHN9_TRICU|nr:ig-like domain-containing protein [Trichonephila clavata]